MIRLGLGIGLVKKLVASIGAAISSALTQEDGSYLLQEDGSKILWE